MEARKMDKEKHLIDETLGKMIDDGFDFEDVIGQEVSFKVTGMLDDKGRWNLDAEAVFGLTRNGVDWVRNEIPISTADDDYDSALATTMLAIANALNNPRMLAVMRVKLNEQIDLPETTKEVM